MFHSEVFWVGVSFFLFVALVFRPVGRILVSALDKRAARIQEELNEALRLKEEAQALLASYQRKQKEVVEEAANIIAHAEEESKRIAEESAKQLEESVNKRIGMAMEKIAGYEASVLQEIRSNAVDIAVSTMRSLIAENMNKEMAEELIDDAILDVEKKLH